ncbi:MAG: ECF transporter S component [Christensenellaceae bacterium]|jgi:hypothetical protein|nr:ECF transporter S component [Christensenellaceae bacterium]PWL96039.1 MAG: ECF transporter S component [Selenomonadales bacterium]
MYYRTKKMVILAVMCAMAYVLMLVCKIPVVLFLEYEPKDVIIAMGGFMFGPLSAVIISVIVSFVEMLTISDTAWWGMIMNIISSCSFAGVAALVYKKKHTLAGAAAGLCIGWLFTAGIMMLWNYLFTPIYMGVSRETVAGMLLPFFLPYNLIKGGVNTALTMLLYKPVVTALRKAHLLPEPKASSPKIKPSDGKSNS